MFSLPKFYYSINKGNVDRNDAFYKTIESSVIGKLREKLNFASRYSRRLKTIRLTYFLHWLWASGFTPLTFKKLKQRTTPTLRWLKKNLTGNKLRTDIKLFNSETVKALYRAVSKMLKLFTQSVKVRGRINIFFSVLIKQHNDITCLIVVYWDFTCQLQSQFPIDQYGR